MFELQNRPQILQAIHERGPISRSAIAQDTGISLSSVSLIARDLLQGGLIEETGAKRQALGRPSILLAVRADAASFAGACINDDRLVVLLTDLKGRILGQRICDLPDFQPETAVQEFSRLVAELRESSGVSSTSLAGAGFAVSGLVDTASGVCLHSTVLGWRNVRIRDLLEKFTGIPVELENDANCVAVGEKLYGNLDVQGEDFAVLSVGQGIGAGLFLRGRLHQGRHGVSGELGHCTIDPAGPPCRCGKRGCLEAIAGIPAILASARAAGVEAADLDELEALASHSTAARTVLQRAGEALGLGLSHLVNLFSPALIIVTGSGTRLGAVLQEALQASLSRNMLPLLPEPPRLVFHHEDESVWARGAASLAAQAFINRGGDAPAPLQQPRNALRT
jgi:predicted NBD/HSP70 family sugar kinase